MSYTFRREVNNFLELSRILFAEVERKIDANIAQRVVYVVSLAEDYHN